MLLNKTLNLPTLAYDLIYIFKLIKQKPLFFILVMNVKITYF